MTIDEVLATARARLTRVSPAEALAAQADGALLVDIRPAHQRAGGEIPGAVVVDRNVLEWRLDPASPHRIAAITGYERTIVVVCDQGYASSLAAAGLQDLGLTGATDLDGGYQAWVAAGLPTTTPHGVL